MAYKVKNKDGKEVTHEIDDKIGAAITDAVESAVADVAGTIGDTVKQSLAEALKPVSERLDKVEAAAKAGEGAGGAAGGGGGSGGGKVKGGKSDEDDPVLAAIGKLTETVTGLVKERESERTARTTEQMVRGYFDRHLPHLKGRDRLIARAVSAAPKDEAALKALVADYQAEYADVVGKDAAAKAFSASPAKEGKAQAGDTDAAEAKRLKLEAIKAHKPELVSVGTA